jgi:hypothetical protein
VEESGGGDLYFIQGVRALQQVGLRRIPHPGAVWSSAAANAFVPCLP